MWCLSLLIKVLVSSLLDTMGTYLSKPKTEKVSQDGENHRVRYGLSSMQGWRTSMEDAVSRNHWPSNDNDTCVLWTVCLWNRTQLKLLLFSSYFCVEITPIYFFLLTLGSLHDTVSLLNNLICPIVPRCIKWRYVWWEN